MMTQVALLARGGYSRQGDRSSITIALPGGRRQTIFGRAEQRGDEAVGMLYTGVGPVTFEVDMRHLLEANAGLRHSRVAIHDGEIICLALFSMENTSVRECAPILQELAAVADDLENRYFLRDIS
jgi:hypothetical protein